MFPYRHPCVCNYLQKAPAKPKKTKEVEKPKAEEEAEAPAENGEAKDEVRPRGRLAVALMLRAHQNHNSGNLELKTYDIYYIVTIDITE